MITGNRKGDNKNSCFPDDGIKTFYTFGVLNFHRSVQTGMMRSAASKIIPNIAEKHLAVPDILLTHSLARVISYNPRSFKHSQNIFSQHSGSFSAVADAFSRVTRVLAMYRKGIRITELRTFVTLII